MDPLQILWVGQSCFQPNAGVKSHTHPYFHMILILRGQDQFEVAGHPITLNEGQCLIIPPDTDHTFSNCTEANTEHLELKFTITNPAMYTRVLRVSSRALENELANALFKHILHEYATHGSPADDAPAAYLTALLHALTEEDRHQSPRQFSYVDASGFSVLAQRVIRYLETHYAEDVSLDALATALGYNKTYLCGVFKKDTDLTILDCLNTIRIRRAAELIVYSDHSLTQVSELCGFSSVSHFNRVFLKYVGATPGQCRRAYPVDILFSSEKTNEAKSTDSFMYSVLARKRFSPQAVRELNARSAEKDE